MKLLNPMRKSRFIFPLLLLCWLPACPPILTCEDLAGVWEGTFRDSLGSAYSNCAFDGDQFYFMVSGVMIGGYYDIGRGPDPYPITLRQHWVLDYGWDLGSQDNEFSYFGRPTVLPGIIDINGTSLRVGFNAESPVAPKSFAEAEFLLVLARCEECGAAWPPELDSIPRNR